MVSRLVASPVRGASARILRDTFLTDDRAGYAVFNNCVMPEHFPPVGEAVLDLLVRDDDLWVCSFPKTGTTWTQEMVWCIANNLDFASSKRIPLDYRFPFLEVGGLFSTIEWRSTIREVAQMTGPRFIKTHLPFHLLPIQLQKRQTKAKIIVVSRNPMDTCVSYYHHCKRFEQYTGSFDQFVTLFLEDGIAYAPYDDNLLSYWKLKGDPNILFLKFEEMKKDLPSVIKEVSTFLGKKYSEDEVKQLAEHLSFDKMKENRARESKPNKNSEEEWSFPFRKGKVGSWQEEMSPETVERFRAWTRERFQAAGIEWEYSI